MKKERRFILASSVLFLLTLGVVICGWVPGVWAEYPERPITLIVPYPPGGVTDLGARALAQALEKHLNQSVVVVNKAGGGTTIGGNAVVTAKPDGYTLGFFPSSASIPEVYSYFYQAPYSSRDLKAVCKIAVPILTICVKGDSPMNTVQDLVEYARKNPGTKIGVHGKSTVGYLAMRTIAKKEKVSFVDVPFDGDTVIVPNILGGHVPAGTPAYPSVQSLVASKQIKVLAMLIESRADFAPSIPTISEAGYKLPAGVYLGVFAPGETPDGVVKRINDVVARISREPEFREKVHGMGIQVMFDDTASFAKSIKQYTENLRAFFKEEGLIK